LRFETACSDFGDWPGDVEPQQPDLVAVGRGGDGGARPSCAAGRDGGRCDVRDPFDLVGPAHAPLLDPLPLAIVGPGRSVVEETADVPGLVLELAPQRSGPCLDRLSPAAEVVPALLEVLRRAAPSERSCASCACRADPVSTPAGPT
jgi:hypothetical protein